MGDDIAIKVEKVSKKYCKSLKRSMWYGIQDIARNMIGLRSHSDHLRKDEFWALNDISFEVKRGETVGIIGDNGAGKTTLLQLLNGIFWPDKGKITIRGRVGSLIMIGAGFHPLLTGRENIPLNGTILGMTKKEIDERLNSIIEFADIGEFIDVPVKFYSSGMFVRLGFAIAVHCNPDILLVDEVLAVGDWDFTLKCYRKIANFRLKGGTIVLVSHNLSLVKEVCNKAIWINNGIIGAMGEVGYAITAYERYVIENKKYSLEIKRTRTDDKAEISKVEFINKRGETVKEYNVGDPLILRIYYRTERVVKKPIFQVAIYDIKDTCIICSYSNRDGFNLDELNGEGVIEYMIDRIVFAPGKYFCSCVLKELVLENNLDWHDRCYDFLVIGEFGDYGFLNLSPKWNKYK